MHSINLTAYLVVSTDFDFTKQTLNLHHSLLDELRQLSGLLEVPLKKANGTCMPSINLLSPSERSQLDSRLWFKAASVSEKEIIEISTDAQITDTWQMTKANGDIVQVEGEEAMLYNKIDLAHDFLKRMWDIIFVSNLACVGVLNLEIGKVMTDGRLFSDMYPRISVAPLQGAYELAETIGWPKIRRMDFKKIWNWAIRQDGFLEGFSNNRTTRALNAFTNLSKLDMAFNPMQLVWALVGLEALYARGSSSLLEQVRDKSQLFLGEQTAFKKKINRMYDFRSRFVHGDLDFPGIYILGESRDEVVKFDNDLVEAISLATAILIATLQEIVERDWNGLDFTYRISDTS
jgi:hypothetical protein